MTDPIKVFHKGADADFSVLVEDPELLTKYKKGDTTIPLIDIVNIYKIYVTRGGGSEGILEEASKSELANEFGSDNVDDAIKAILKDGEIKSTTNARRGGSSTNDSNGVRGYTN